MGKLENKVAIITGSTSGMGRDTAYLFAKEGAKVVITGRNEARAKAVYDYFIASGVSADRLSYAGYGMDRPIATNDTPEGRQQNRRVELNVIE